MKAEMTAAQLTRAIEVTRPRIAEATARANAVQVKTPAKVRCAHYNAIRTFMAIAREKDLDTTNKKGMRAAFSVMLGFTIATRADLTGQQWGAAITALRSGAMWW